MADQRVPTGISAAVWHANGLTAAQGHDLVAVEIGRERLEVARLQIFPNERLDGLPQRLRRRFADPPADLVLAEPPRRLPRLRRRSSRIFSKSP